MEQDIALPDALPAGWQALAAAFVSSQYLSGLQFSEVDVAVHLTCRPSFFIRAVRKEYGTYAKFLGNILPDLTKTIKCHWCRRLVQVSLKNNKIERPYCHGCQKACAINVIWRMHERGESISYRSVANHERFGWITSSSQALWGISYRELLFAELGLVLPPGLNGAARRSKPGQIQYKNGTRKRSVPKPFDRPVVEKKFKQNPLLTPREQEEIVKSNIALAKYFARSLAARRRMRCMSFEDLAHAGVLGLMRAAETFDPKANVHFSTYASWWIKQAQNRSLYENNYSLRVPARYDMRNDPDGISLVVSLDSASRAYESAEEEASQAPSNSIQVHEDGFAIAELFATLENLGVAQRSRDIFYLRAMHNVPFDDIASKYGLTGERVRQLYAATRSVLKSAYILERTTARVRDSVPAGPEPHPEEGDRGSGPLE